MHGIPLDRNVPSGPIWNEHLLRWEQSYVPLPIVDGQPVLLVPKYFVRWKLSIDSQEFYNHFMVEFLREENLEAMTSLVRFFKGTGQPYVLKKDVKARHPYAKDSLAAFVRDHPKVLEDYKELKGAKGALENDEFEEGFRDSDFARVLIDNLARIPPGMRDASRYHFFYIRSSDILVLPSTDKPS